MTTQESSAPHVTRLSKKRLGVQPEPRRKIAFRPRDTCEKGSRMRQLERANIAAMCAALQSVLLCRRPPRIRTLQLLTWAATAIATFSLVVPAAPPPPQSPPVVAEADPARLGVHYAP